MKMMTFDEEIYYKKEKELLIGTLYRDFDHKLKKNSIYKSIRLIGVKDGTAYYETEPYDDAYKTGDHFFEDTCHKIERAFKKYYPSIFSKYHVNNISVEIYDENSCDAGLSVLPDGNIVTSNF